MAKFLIALKFIIFSNNAKISYSSRARRAPFLASFQGPVGFLDLIPTDLRAIIMFRALGHHIVFEIDLKSALADFLYIN